MKVIIISLLVALAFSQGNVANVEPDMGTISLVAGWYRGSVSRYYNFGGVQSTGLTGAQLNAPIIYILSNADGVTNNFRYFVSTSIQGANDYSGLWTISNVVYTGSASEPMRASDITNPGANPPFTVTPTTNYLNCPIVGEAVTGRNTAELSNLGQSRHTVRDVTLRMGWWGGEMVRCFDFGSNPRSTLPIYPVRRNGDTDPVDGNNIIDAVPGDAGYSDFWIPSVVVVGDDYVANSIVSKCQLGSTAITPESNPLVNCPVVHTETAVSNNLSNQFTPFNGAAVASTCASDAGTSSASTLATSLVVIGGVFTALFF